MKLFEKFKNLLNSDYDDDFYDDYDKEYDGNYDDYIGKQDNYDGYVNDYINEEDNDYDGEEILIYKNKLEEYNSSFDNKSGFIEIDKASEFNKVNTNNYIDIKENDYNRYNEISYNENNDNENNYEEDAYSEDNYEDDLNENVNVSTMSFSSLLSIFVKQKKNNAKNKIRKCADNIQRTNQNISSKTRTFFRKQNKQIRDWCSYRFYIISTKVVGFVVKTRYKCSIGISKVSGVLSVVFDFFKFVGGNIKKGCKYTYYFYKSFLAALAMHKIEQEKIKDAKLKNKSKTYKEKEELAIEMRYYNYQNPASFNTKVPLLQQYPDVIDENNVLNNHINIVNQISPIEFIKEYKQAQKFIEMVRMEQLNKVEDIQYDNLAP